MTDHVYTCGTCGSQVLIIEGWPGNGEVEPNWHISCGNGHTLVPTGARIVVGHERNVSVAGIINTETEERWDVIGEELVRRDPE